MRHLQYIRERWVDPYAQANSRGGFPHGISSALLYVCCVRLITKYCNFADTIVKALINAEWP